MVSRSTTPRRWSRKSSPRRARPPEGVAEDALHKLPGFKRIEIAREALTEEARRQLGKS